MSSESHQTGAIRSRSFRDLGPDLKVLVADDAPTERAILKKMLANYGHSVILAADGQEAVDLFRAEQPDLVLLDVMMPRMNGMEAARIIKEESGQHLIPIIFLTSLVDADALAQCLESGGDDFLSKPYSPTLLQAKINAARRMRQFNATLAEQHDQIAAHNQRMVHEQEAAKAVFDSVAHQGGSLKTPNVVSMISPLSVFNGDVLLICRKPGMGIHVLLGDFTGHGLPAAIGAMPLAEVFYGMTRKGFALPDIASEINRKLKLMLPVGLFCCAGIVDVDYANGEAEFWLGGLPDCLICRKDGVETLRSQHMPLGILGPSEFRNDTQRVRLAPGDRFYLWSDGIIESSNEAGEMFGEERLHAVVAHGNKDCSVINRVEQAIVAHTGDRGADDDLTMVEVTMIAAEDDVRDEAAGDYAGHSGPRDWRFSYRLSDESLRRFDPLPLILSVVTEVPGLRRRSGEVFTLLSEMYNNALEHGLLRLDSALKRSVTGFTEYYLAREQRLSELRDAWINITIDHCSYTEGGGCLTIGFQDSGEGFDLSRFKAGKGTQADCHQYSGRGIALLRQLCKSVEYVEPGNQVVVEFEWR